MYGLEQYGTIQWYNQKFQLVTIFSMVHLAVVCNTLPLPQEPTFVEH